MLALKLLRLCSPMCRITPTVYETLYVQFTTKPEISTLGIYFTSQNLLQVYNIVKNTKVNPPTKIALLEEIAAQLCTENTDMEFNILANMHKDKSVLYMQQGRLAEAIIEIEQAVKAIQAMEQPFNLEVATLLQTAGNLHTKAKNYAKAAKFLKDAEHILNLTEQQILENTEVPASAKQQLLKMINVLMAEVMSQFCLVHMQQMHRFEAGQYLNKALQRWKSVQQQKRNTLAYLIAIKFKCILHIWAKQQKWAIEAAKEYLQGYEPTQETVGHRMWFMKFLNDQGIDIYAKELKANIQELSKTMSEKDLTDLLIKLGVLRKKEGDKEKEKEKGKDTGIKEKKQ